MKLIEMRCPNCNAPLSVNADRDEAFCRHCNTTFLIEDAPKADMRKRANAAGESADKLPGPEAAPVEETAECEKAKSEPPAIKRFIGVVSARLETKPDTRPTKKEYGANRPKRTPATGKTVAPDKSAERTAARRYVTIAVVLLVAIIALAEACSMHNTRESASPGMHETSSTATTSVNSEAGVRSSSSTSSAHGTTDMSSTSAAATQASPESSSSTPESSSSTPESSSSTPESSSKAKDGFPCNLDSSATFSGVTIPIDSTWKNYSPAWDWRHKTFSYRAGSAKLEDVQVSISTFTGGDTKDAFAFMEDYADFAPIYLDNGKYRIRGEDTRDGVRYTRIEGVDSDYESAFSANSPSKHQAIREGYASRVVRCVCLVGYAKDGTGFAVAVSLCGSADNDDCIYSANKVLDGVTFVPAECDTDSVDSWLYEVQH